MYMFDAFQFISFFCSVNRNYKMIEYMNLDVFDFKSIYWTIVCFAHYMKFRERKVNWKIFQLFEQQHQTID